MGDTDDQYDFSDNLPIGPFMSQAYLKYAMSVALARALPRGSDGLKPVQRRILFDMLRLGVTSTSKHIKVARVVGDTMGKYHPHGDKSISDAMIRMAQDFTLRYPLIDGQGNFGSRDGDGAAAPRYIESRLTSFADLMLSELDLGTVEFVPNYDGSFEEPAVLPARLPFVLLNGAKGTAVGYATEIPSHNLKEVAAAVCMLIRKPDASLEEILTVLPAPDFPNGGQIISSKTTISEAYRVGQGSIRMRARWRREDLARGQWRVVVYEMPHEVSSAKILAEIESLTNPQIRAGKKELSTDQKNVKALLLSVVDVVRDEANKDEPVRLVIEPKSSKQNIDELMGILLAHTDLESSVPINMVMVGNDGNPKCKGVLSILEEWIDFRFTTVENRLKSRKGAVEHRLHILAGRLIAFASLDAVIKVIRESGNPKDSLVVNFGLSEIQAEDILEIRLRQLARLEGFKIEKEGADLKSELEGIMHLLSDRAALTNLILNEVESDAKKYGDDRRTLVDEVQATRPAEISVPDEPVTVILSKNGWIRSRSGHGVDRASIAFKPGDSEFAVLESRSANSIVLLDTNGRAYSIKICDLPTGRGDGVPVATLVDLQEGPNGMGKIAHAICGAPDARYLFANSGGYGFISTVGEMIGAKRAGKAFMVVEKDEVILPPTRVTGNSVYAINGGGKGSRLILFPLADMKVLPKGGRGVIVMKLGSNEILEFVGTGGDESVTINGNPRSITINGDQLTKYKLNRAAKGCLLPVTMLVSSIS